MCSVNTRIRQMARRRGKRKERPCCRAINIAHVSAEHSISQNLAFWCVTRFCEHHVSQPSVIPLDLKFHVDYKTVRPHSSLNGATPDEFARITEGARRLTPARPDEKDGNQKPEVLSLSV
jgi:hypothetical protein